LGERDEVVGGHGDEAARDLDDVEAELACLVEVAVDCFRPLGKHVFEEAAGGDAHVVAVAELDQVRRRCGAA
jgi:hypothetical protein